MQNHYSAPHAGRVTPSDSGAPNAALLIDFDNVTMGMRSDLAKELKNLLDSDIIKGKVTVQRAYADWRRYPQYIVPLSEASIDLIFAPAYGSSKKNATDIRMAIDGMELVFIRPEIGTFILLTGDSDFSSLVLKLKEYGKYVIGIGIQESSSDILVQNCDEYYSYTSLTGLSRTSEGGGPDKLDPWQCVTEAMARMTARGDVMRSDRLKQVMMEVAPDFDERNLGFRKFSKFLVAAANKGLIRIERGADGQYGVASPDGATAEKASPVKASAPARASSPSKASSPATVASTGRASAPAKASSTAKASGAKASAAGKAPVAGKAPTAGKASVTGKSPVAGKAPAPGKAPAKRSRAAAPGQAPAGDGRERAPEGEGVRPAASDRAPALDLLRRALREFGDKGREGVRDSDVKRRLLALDKGFDEGALGFSKFSKFLQFAQESGAVALAGLDGGGYDVRLAAEGGRGTAKGPSRNGGKPRDHRRRSRTAADANAKSGTDAQHGVDAKALGLPTTAEAARSYLTHRYRGVGVKTANTLVETFGEGLFGVLQNAPDKVRALLPRARAERVLSAWREDYRRRKAAMPAQPDAKGASARVAGGAASRAEPAVGAPTPAPRERTAAVRERAGSQPSVEKKASPGLMGLFRRRNRGDGAG